MRIKWGKKKIYMEDIKRFFYVAKSNSSLLPFFLKVGNFWFDGLMIMVLPFDLKVQDNSPAMSTCGDSRFALMTKKNKSKMNLRMGIFSRQIVIFNTFYLGNNILKM